MPDEEPHRRCPVAFDHHSSEHVANWPQTFRKLRQECPRPWSEKYGGYWIATKYKDIIKVAQNPERFFVQKTVDPDTGTIYGGVIIPVNSEFIGLPNEADPPLWNSYRPFLNEKLGATAAEGPRANAKVFAAALIDMVIEKGKFDIVDDLTGPLPALVTMDLLGIPLREWRDFADPLHKMAYVRHEDPTFVENASNFSTGALTRRSHLAG